jgi:hypothetical protein
LRWVPRLRAKVNGVSALPGRVPEDAGRTGTALCCGCCETQWLLC